MGADRRQGFWWSAGSPAWWRCAFVANTSRPIRRTSNCGDHVVIINGGSCGAYRAQARQQGLLQSHTGFIGGIKERTATSILEGRFSRTGGREGSSAYSARAAWGGVQPRQFTCLPRAPSIRHRGPAARDDRRCFDESQEHEGRIRGPITMQSSRPVVAAEAGGHRKRRNTSRRLTSRAVALRHRQRKDALPGSGSSPGAGKITRQPPARLKSISLVQCCG